VINKVLRDLDQRQAAAAAQVASGQASGDQLMRGTQALSGPATNAPKRLWIAAAAVVTLLLAGLAVWWMNSPRSVVAPDLAQAKPTQTLAVPVTEAASASVPLTAALPTPIQLPIVPTDTPKPAPSLAAVAIAKPATGLVKTAPVPGPHLAPVMAPAPASNVALQVVSPVAPPAIPAAAVPVAQVKPAADNLQLGVTQALAQAQAMWNEGSKESAIDLLRQALNRVEAISQGNSRGPESVSLVALARELARMELADSQVNNALKLLTRLEPQIAQVADLWAMRGNAAQRLGQHADAASNYRRALRLKPDEPRWMLGLAVSLAVQGQTAEAAELAEKTRALGALQPEIANYLRQLGVPIRSE
jgi:predicted negative regulator of RcsB-dependent stress response